MRRKGSNLLVVGIGLLLGGPAMAGPAPSASTALRASVRSALAAPGDNFNNRYVKSVWLQTMSVRLKPYIDNADKRKQLLLLVHAEAVRAKVPPSLVLAMMNVESAFKPWAVSSVGAQGLMQIMPFWLKVAGKPGDNLFNPQTNVRIGCTVLAYYLKRSHGDLTEALQRYYGKRFGTTYAALVIKLLNSRWYWQN
ncbi:MAG: transglycosylase SLT domain-containing protein [Gammaproteobacteria bacterium]